ncbi:MAG TPA: methyltransferase, partial [Aquificae bacterium]|nr:methyltransferase [Aquificota bacterium]
MENLVDVRGKKVLDMGTGTGIQAINALKRG